MSCIQRMYHREQSLTIRHQFFTRRIDRKQITVCEKL